ncbi:Capsule polysaccharide biosynthesis protein [Neorhodopirellula lusitana]|uniref:Capsule polysaccharide biosynthesis protein n=2 Tax=Neorhodopirellula lusitana TaxID=445327 RepID=A0ABY1PWY8_9BACT|nr:Capsule polysaccharide biosynthesis protein [Neorhodopirellula lusitana]
MDSQPVKSFVTVSPDPTSNELGPSDQSSPHVLVQLPSPQKRRAFLLMLAYAKQLEKADKNPILSYCGVTGGSCASNLVGNRLVCLACQKSVQDSVSDIGLPLVRLDRNTPQTKKRKLSFSERRSIVEGVRSCLVTLLRVLSKDLGKISVAKTLKRKLFKTATTLLRASHHVIDEYNISETAVLNGRYACRKSLVIASMSKGIPFNTLDFNLYGMPMVFRGHTPHDRTAIQTRMLSNTNDLEIANKYFQAREEGTVNRFAASHRQFSPPAEATNYERKISYFLSSQDECESLGPSWRSPFRDNATVIFQAAVQFPKTYFCVRFHPNQASILSDVNEGFEQLKELKNVQLYAPNDDINSYTLIDWSDIVVTFASTIAVEACWRKKPVIQLGPSLYDQLGISETPKSIEEFLSLLESDVHPCGRESASKYANYSVTDFDELDYLNYEDGDMQPVGFRRRFPTVVVPLAQMNEISKRLLKRFIRYHLKPRRSAA